MIHDTTREEMWAKQHICCSDVDYRLWSRKKESLQKLSQLSQTCLFTVDVYKQQYNFASENFTHILGYKSSFLREVEKQGDFLEERIHPEDQKQLIESQIRHSQFVYSLPFRQRNKFQTIYQFRMLNAHQKYINIISRQQVLLEDRRGKAWIISGMLDISPDQSPLSSIKTAVLDLNTGNIFNHPTSITSPPILTSRENEILLLIQKGLLSKEIANKLDISIHTVNNHRKSILLKFGVDNAIEAINFAKERGILS
jgi:DNA-binding CsgD family transcriptional regulator